MLRCRFEQSSKFSGKTFFFVLMDRRRESIDL